MFFYSITDRYYVTCYYVSYFEGNFMRVQVGNVFNFEDLSFCCS